METSSAELYKVPAVAIAGSVLERVARLREAMEQELRKQYPEIRFVEAPADPPLGALWNARHREIGAVV
jgi:hypothetical protein